MRLTDPRAGPRLGVRNPCVIRLMQRWTGAGHGIRQVGQSDCTQHCEGDRPSCTCAVLRSPLRCKVLPAWIAFAAFPYDAKGAMYRLTRRRQTSPLLSPSSFHPHTILGVVVCTSNLLLWSEVLIFFEIDRVFELSVQNRLQLCHIRLDFLRLLCELFHFLIQFLLFICDSFLCFR